MVEKVVSPGKNVPWRCRPSVNENLPSLDPLPPGFFGRVGVVTGIEGYDRKPLVCRRNTIGVDIAFILRFIFPKGLLTRYDFPCHSPFQTIEPPPRQSETTFVPNIREAAA
jgi:hypothetical protein